MIEILVGMIGSGKSTYSKEKAKSGFLIACQDNMVNSVHGLEYTLYSDSNDSLYKSLLQCVISYGMKNDRDIIIDNSNIKRKTRKKYIDYIKSINSEEKIICVKFPIRTAESHAKARFESDSRNISLASWVKIAEEHILKYEEPSLDEGFYEIRDFK